jgi:isopenicillin N synthase-like dioxygenase
MRSAAARSPFWRDFIKNRASGETGWWHMERLLKYPSRPSVDAKPSGSHVDWLPRLTSPQ